MARKSFMYSVLEAVQYEMRQDKNMIWIFELTPPVASNPGKPVINLEKEFGRNARGQHRHRRELDGRMRRWAPASPARRP